MTTEKILTSGGYVFSILLKSAQFLVIVGLVIFGIIQAIKLIKRNNLLKYKKTLIVSVICIIIAALSLRFNMGWLRYIMILTLIPIIHPIVFLVTNLYAAQYINEFRWLKASNFLFVITYLVFWILLPDSGDMGPSYCLFNLVRNDDFTNVAFVVSWIAGIAHILLFVIQIIQLAKIKKSIML